jgi:hypothetical protein
VKTQESHSVKVGKGTETETVAIRLAPTSVDAVGRIRCELTNLGKGVLSATLTTFVQQLCPNDRARSRGSIQRSCKDGCRDHEGDRTEG